MSGGCFLETVYVLSYYHEPNGTWEELHYYDEEYEQFLNRWGFDHYDEWYILRLDAVHARNCTYSGCTWQPVDTGQPIG